MEYANYIAHCIEIARRGEYFVAPNPMVGAVLVDADGTILAEGWHEKYGEGHAEVNCFRHLETSKYRDLEMSKCTLFVSLEPCSHYGKTPPCAKLIIEKGVGRVVVGMLDPNPLVAGKGVQMLREAGIEVIVGVMEKECRELNKRFLCLHEKHRPYVVLKWAQTEDGYVDRIRQYSVFSNQSSAFIFSWISSSCFLSSSIFFCILSTSLLAVLDFAVKKRILFSAVFISCWSRSRIRRKPSAP